MPQVDQIIMLENGCIVEMGTYEELIEQKRSFMTFVEKYLHQTDESNSESKDLK